LAASVVKYGPICLKLATLNFTCFLNVIFECNLPRYLKTPEHHQDIFTINKNIGVVVSQKFSMINTHTVLFTFRCKHELFSQFETCAMAAVSLFAACCLFFACTYRTSATHLFTHLLNLAPSVIIFIKIIQY